MQSFLAVALGTAICLVMMGFDRGPRHEGGNETAAIATLRNIRSAQQQFRERGLADEDGDGIGEFGSFGELSAEVFVRGTNETLTPPVLSTAFRSVNEAGIVSRSGYHFRLFLPGKDGRAVTEIGNQEASVIIENPTGAASCGCCGSRRLAASGAAFPRPLDPDGAERRWFCYAWPVAYGDTGQRSFFMNQDGVILSAEDRGYSGGAGPTEDDPTDDGNTWTRMD